MHFANHTDGAGTQLWMSSLFVGITGDVIHA